MHSAKPEPGRTDKEFCSSGPAHGPGTMAHYTSAPAGVEVRSPSVSITPERITSRVSYASTSVEVVAGIVVATPTTQAFVIETRRRAARVPPTPAHASTHLLVPVP